MKLKCIVPLNVILLIAVVQSASIEKRYIPVEIIYDEPVSVFSSRNLNEKVQLPERELIQNQLKINQAIEQGKESISEIKPSKLGNPNGVKNLQEKIQLSPDELKESLKHLPNVQDDSIQEESIVLKSNFPSAQTSRQLIMKQAEEIILNGLTRIREQANNINDEKPKEEAWKKLNQSVQDYFKNQAQSSLTKQDNQNNQALQNIINAFQNFTGNFIQNFQQSQRPANATQDEQPSIGQSFINYFTGGVQQIANNINSLGGQSSTTNSVLGDTGVSPTTERPNIFSNIINSVQQAFSGATNPPSQSINLNQSDTGTQPPSNPSGFFQGAINQFNQVVNNLIPSSSTQNPVQGDELVSTSTTQPRPIEVIQSIGNQIGSVFNQVNPFAQSSTKPPNSSGDEGVSSTTQRGPIEVIQSIGNQIGSAFNQVNPFASSPKPPNSEDEGTGSTQGSNFVQNVGQVFQNINPFRPQNGQNDSNPITSGVQNVGTQIQQLVGQQNSSNPFTSGVQNVGNQIQGLVGQQNGSNPLTSGAENFGNQLQGLAGQQNGSNPLVSGAQNFGNQIQGLVGQQNGSNPLTSGAQNFGNQLQGLVGQQNGSNPLVSGAQNFSNQIQGLVGQQNGTNPISSGIENASSQIQGLVPNNPVVTRNIENIVESSTEKDKIAEDDKITTEDGRNEKLEEKESTKKSEDKETEEVMMIVE